MFDLYIDDMSAKRIVSTDGEKREHNIVLKNETRGETLNIVLNDTQLIRLWALCKNRCEILKLIPLKGGEEHDS